MKYAGETLKDTAKAAICGEELIVSKEEKERRLNICKGCEHYTELCGQPRCNECGCMMLIKTELTTAKCPCNKW